MFIFGVDRANRRTEKMITKLVLRNFKSISEQTFEFTNFDLLVGRNNTGKSTILQAIAIWQFCVDEFQRAKRKGKSGIQIVLPNFSALPVPEFNLLWKDKTERRYPVKNNRKSQEYILIEIDLTWLASDTDEHTFGVQLRYHSPQAVYAIPKEGWNEFSKHKEVLPTIAFVPPFSGLEPSEEWRDTSVIKKQVGKAQPGSVLRNLLLLVRENPVQAGDWSEIANAVRRWFSIDLLEPQYERGIDTLIRCEYKQAKKTYDIIAGGSGFHQTLTMLAFLYGYSPTTILLDEPDAHLHVNLQREVLDFFKQQSVERHTQFLIATHSEELVNGVASNQIISLHSGAPTRNRQVNHVLAAMADVSNQEETQLHQSPYLLYVEGESDARLIRAWAQLLDEQESLGRFCFHYMHGGNKKLMMETAGTHYMAVKEIIPEVERFIVFDFDGDRDFHPKPDNPALFEWSRQNIENYLLVPDAWVRFVVKHLKMTEDDLFATEVKSMIMDYFSAENLTLPKKASWKSLSANVFKVVDGKSLLFTGDNALTRQLTQHFPNAHPTPDTVALSMKKSEIHEDVLAFFSKLSAIG